MIKIYDKKVSFLDKLALYLSVLIPFSLISGPFLPDLSIVIVSSIFLYLTLSGKVIINYKNNYLLAFIAFYIICIISSLLSSDPLLSLESSLFYFRFLLFPCAFFYLLMKFNDQFLKSIFFVLIISIIIIFISVFFQAIISNFYHSQYAGIFGNEQKSGSFTARFYPLIVGLTIYFNHSIKSQNLNYFLILIFILSSIIIVLSGERTSLLLFMISNFLFLIFFKSLRKFLIYSSIIGLIFGTLLSQTILKASFERHIVKTINEIVQTRSFSEHYKGHYITGLNMFKRNVLFGIGPKLFRIECHQDHYKYIWNTIELRSGPTNKTYLKDQNSCATHPHNSYIQLLAEVGIFGFSFLSLLL
ncbi:O-antigen ligase family protein, partial [Alphaproteobacteria bacterium]|nr:O-antigen ligase family protein [Alphaproteobacteria bacterium]